MTSVIGLTFLMFNVGVVSASPPGSGITGPFWGAPVSPVSVDLGALPSGGGAAQHPLPFLHPRGEAVLDQQRAESAALAPSTGIQSPATGSTLTPTNASGFEAISSAESSCNCYPPDGAVAVSSSQIVGAVNTAVKVFDKTGAVLKAATSLGTFFSGAGCYSNFSDPDVQYDRATGHFILGVLTYNRFYSSIVCVAVSQTSDATGSWWLYAFANAGTGDLLDFPQVAIGSDAVYLAGNQFQNGASFVGARVYAYNKAAIEAGLTSTPVYFNVGNDATGNIADSLYPAKDVSVAKTMYFLGADNNFATGNNISAWKWSDPFGTNVFALQGGVTVTTYSQPVTAQESGGTTAVPDARNLGAAYYQGTIYGAHTTACFSGKADCVQWYQIGNLDTSPSLVTGQQGIYGNTGQYRYYPNLSTDSVGDMLIAYAYSSGTEYPGINYTGRLAGDAAGTLEAESTMVAGKATINGGRYGDYAGEQVDTDGCTAWHLEEYAPSSGLWDTWVGSMRFSGCGANTSPDFSVSASPSSQTVSAGGSTSYTATVASTGGFSSPVTLSAGVGPADGTVGTSFSSNPVTPPANGSANSTLSVTTTGASTGTYTITITGTSGSTTHSTSVQLVIQAPVTPGFSVSANPTTLTVQRGTTKTSTITATSVGTFSGTVSWTFTGCPFCSISPTSVNVPSGGSASSTFSVKPISSTPKTTYTVTITGTSGGVSRTVTITVKVTGAGQ